MTTDTDTRPSLWARSRQWLTAFAVAMEYDSSQYIADRTASLQAELVELRARIAHLESGQCCDARGPEKIAA